MGRNDNTWSDRHRSAIGYAQAEQGMTSSQAVKAGKAGELGLPPFEMSESYARETAQAYERGEIERPDLEDKADQTARRLQTWLDQELGRLFARGKVQHFELKRLAELQISICAITRQPARPQRLPRTRAKGAEHQDTPELIANLLQQTAPNTDQDTNEESGSG